MRRNKFLKKLLVYFLVFSLVFGNVSFSTAAEDTNMPAQLRALKARTSQEGTDQGGGAGQGGDAGQGGWYDNYVPDEDAYKTGDKTTTTDTTVINVTPEEMDSTILDGTSFSTSDFEGDVSQEDLDQLAAELGDGYVVVYNHMERDGSGDQTKYYAGGDVKETHSNDTEVEGAETKTVVRAGEAGSGTYLAIYKLKAEETPPATYPPTVTAPPPPPTPTAGTPTINTSHLTASLESYDSKHMKLVGTTCVHVIAMASATRSDSHKVYVKLTGFKIDGKNEFELLEDKQISLKTEKPTWSIDGEITQIDGDPNQTRTGKVKVYCKCDGTECCSENFDVTFPTGSIPTLDEEKSHLTAEIVSYDSKQMKLEGETCVHKEVSYEIPSIGDIESSIGDINIDPTAAWALDSKGNMIWGMSIESANYWTWSNGLDDEDSVKAAISAETGIPAKDITLGSGSLKNKIQQYSNLDNINIAPALKQLQSYLSFTEEQNETLQYARMYLNGMRKYNEGALKSLSTWKEFRKLTQRQASIEIESQASTISSGRNRIRTTKYTVNENFVLTQLSKMNEDLDFLEGFKNISKMKIEERFDYFEELLLSSKLESTVSSVTRKSHKVYVELTGFKIDGKNKFELLKDSEIGSNDKKPAWSIDGKITEISGDPNKTRTGKVKVYCKCDGTECCSKNFDVTFNPGNENISHLTAEIVSYDSQKMELKGETCVHETALSSKRESHKVYVELTGFKIDGKNKFELLKDEQIGSNAKKPAWSINGKITQIDGDPNTTRTGKVKVYCKCNGTECCSKNFDVTFNPGDENISHLTAEIVSPASQQMKLEDQLKLKGETCVHKTASNSKSHKVYVELTGFKIDGKNKLELLEDKEIGLTAAKPTWSIDGKITQIDEGPNATRTGKVKVYCKCDGTECCSKNFDITFNPDTEDISHLTVEHFNYDIEEILLSGTTCVHKTELSSKSHKVYAEFTGFEVNGKNKIVASEDKEISLTAAKPTWIISGDITKIDGNPKKIRTGKIKVYCKCDGTECCSENFDVTFDGEIIKETINKEEKEWSDGTEHLTDEEKHLDVMLEPNRTSNSGKLAFYGLGDYIKLSGNNCIDVKKSCLTCIKHEVWTITYKYLVKYDENGQEKERKLLDQKESEHSIGELQGQTIYGDIIENSYKVNINLEGFSLKIRDNTGKEYTKKEYTCLEDKVTTIELPAKAKDWELQGQIVDIINPKYDPERGSFYGTIKVSCACCRNCTREFRLYFDSNPYPEEPVDLIVKISPQGGGIAEVKGPVYNPDSKSFEQKTIRVDNETTIKAKRGGVYEITSAANPNYTYKRVINKDGNVITPKSPEDAPANPLNYQVIEDPTTLIVYFEGPNPGDYDVTFVCDDIDGVKPLKVPEKLTNVPAGKDVDLWTIVKDEYKDKYQFNYWYFEKESGEIITPDSEWDEYTGKGYFIMPDYNVVAHAKPKEKEDVKLTVYIEGEGKVIVDGEEMANGESKIVRKNSNLDLEAISAEHWKLSSCIENNNNSIDFIENENRSNYYNPEKPYSVDKDTVLYFTFGEREKYTLYVTSMEGGNAWPAGNNRHSGNDIIKTTDELGKTVYKIENVEEGEKFYIYYSIKNGYKFGKWEYKPYITDKKENATTNCTYITMPASDLTVTATFKSENESSDPKLRVTTNNALWGTAWTIINKVQTVTNKEYEVKSGTQLKLTRKSETGCYFINWKYSTEFSPFIGKNEIVMPNYNLEVMAMFAPIPTPPIPTPSGATPHKITFSAAPKEGGDVPEDLPAVYSGSKVTIGVTPNIGWIFDYWEVPEGVEIHYEPDGTGYFIMPDKDVEAVAHFKSGMYKLYITHTEGGEAWTYDIFGKNPTSKTTYIEKAIPKVHYELGYQVKEGYEFDGWEYRWNTYDPDKKIDVVENGVQKVIMPYSDLTVTAKFKKIEQDGNYKLRVTSNNYLWGNAWVKVDGKWKSWKDTKNSNNPQAISELGIDLEPDKEYEVCFKEEKGYEFTNWGWTSDIGNLFIEQNDKVNTSQYTGYGKIKISTNDLKSDIELMAYFKPGTPKYTLTVVVDPGEAGKASGSGEYFGGEEYTVKVKVSEGYEFNYWYYEDDNGKTVKEKGEEFTGIMPYHDLTITAYCDDDDDDDDGGGDDGDPEVYTVKVVVEGNGTVTGDIEAVPGRNGEGEFEEGYNVKITANPGSNNKFIGWRIKDKTVSQNKAGEFEVHENMVITACFDDLGDRITDKDSDTFKIISVRDLRWKDYFVGDKNSLTGNYFGVPQQGVMLLNIGSKVKDKLAMDVLKMGYAVEFELTTSQLEPDKAVLIITPKLYDDNGEVSWTDVKDYVASSKGVSIDPSFKKIVIYGDKSKESAKAKADRTKFQTSATVADPPIKNNGESINQITWTWLYYLPADIGYSNYKSRGDELTVKFDIGLYELKSDGTYIERTPSSDGTLKKDIVLFEKTYNGVSWDGSVYKYSKVYSLLEDIYNNATN